jgi:hypothetical protein
VTDFKVGDVVGYLPAERFDRWWCREGTAIAKEAHDGTVTLADTYWQSGGDAHVLTDDELATAELRFNLADYDELDRYDKGSKLAWEKFAEDDRELVTSQHRLECRWFIRKGAVESIDQQIANARARLATAESNLDSARWGVERAQRELAEIEAQAVSS